MSVRYAAAAALASGGEDAPTEPGGPPSRAPPAVADRVRYRCRAPAPAHLEGAMPAFHCREASEPPDRSDSNGTERESYRLTEPLQREAEGPQRGWLTERRSEKDSHNGGINYQFLEQNISHQSILNQSISILNQQVGVVNSAPVQQLVRTADGVVLAVLPAPPGAGVSGHTTSSPARASHPLDITVPLGWRRIITGNSVVYISPSGAALAAQAQLRDYLQTPGTCKCGLQCPLRPDTAFSFDPKVASRASGAGEGERQAELTRLCNHKRKLLAALQAAAAPQHARPHDTPRRGASGMAVESANLKKKTKKKAMLQAGISMSQLMAQRERSLHAQHAQQQGVQYAQHALHQGVQHAPNDYKGWTVQQEAPQERPVAETRTMSPHARPCSQSCPPAIHHSHPHPHPLPVPHSQPDHAGPHYLTVSSGSINQPVANSAQRLASAAAYRHNSPIPTGQPVLGTNGQLIGIHTGGGKPDHQRVPAVHQHVLLDRPIKQEDDRQRPFDNNTQQQVLGRSSGKQLSADDAPGNNMNMFCGLNQVPPEVVQKIDQQQQIFIQQNQKQIQMAMKGIRTQVAPESSSRQARNPYQNQQTPQGQLVIQNGTVMAHPGNMAKTPPWHVKRADNSPAPNPSAQQQNIANRNDEQSASTNCTPEGNVGAQVCPSGGDNYIGNNFVQNMNQMVHSRVPPLHMNYPTSMFPNEPKKKAKTSPSKNKKKINIIDNKNFVFGSNGMRVLQDSKKGYDYVSSNPSPSFMDDPSGYLAQQTALLNNTISRQGGSSIRYDTDGPPGDLGITGMSNDVKLNSKQSKTSETMQYKGHIPHHASPLHNIPDSSALSEKQIDTKSPHCCKGCNGTPNFNQTEYHSETSSKRPFVRQVYPENSSKIKMEADISSPNRMPDDNPVTSSTYMGRSGVQNSCINDSRGPIQGGTVSTSHVSPPEPSPTPSNSSRSADTPLAPPAPPPPHPAPSPARSDPATPGPSLYNSPASQQDLQLSGSQMINFISNHNVNRNLMEVENISNAVVKGSPLNASYRNEQKKIMGNNMLMPGYCPPPHLGGGPSLSLSQTNYVQSVVTTMASGHSVIRDTITSVLAGKAQTATTSINGSLAHFGRQPQPPNLSNSYAIPPNHPDPFLNSVNLPTSYPLHIAGTVTQNIINRTPLEMVQSVVSNIPISRHELGSAPPHPPQSSQNGSRNNVHTGQIIISSTGQIIIPNQGSAMPPPAPKSQAAPGMSSQASSMMTSSAASVTQVMPSMGGVQQVINQPTVLVNTLPAPFVLQPQMMTVDGQVVQQNAMMPQMMTSNLVQPGQSSGDAGDKSGHGMVQRMTLLSPESSKKKGKKRKVQGQNVTSVLHIAAPQHNTGSVLLHHASPQQHSSPQFSPRGFQLSPNSMSPAPMLQALTIVPGKSGTPAHIVMNGQNNFGSQQLINTSPTQQINLLQPVNLINNAGGVVPNFPTFQQFIVPNIGGMVMTADGTAIIQDSSTGMPMQLQLQNVNGQNVLTPIQNQNVLTGGGNTGVVIRTQNPHGKIIQSQHSPGAQFLSPNSHMMMNSPTFGGQLSPLVANVSPTSVTFNTSPHQVRSNIQQEMIQCNQMGQTVMVPLSPKPITTATGNRTSSTFVQQNTTIVQHQTTLVSNSTGNGMASNISQNIQGGGNRLSIDPTILFNHNHKHHKSRSISVESQEVMMASNIPSPSPEKISVHYPQMNHHQHAEPEQNVDRHEFHAKQLSNQNLADMNMGMNDGFNPMLLNGQGGMFAHVRHSVSTQTLVNQQQSRSPPVAVYSSSPPDTTTHSPLGPLEHTAGSPHLYGARSISIQGNYADTTTKSPEPTDSNSSAMVQCVSSSEPDVEPPPAAPAPVAAHAPASTAWLAAPHAAQPTDHAHHHSSHHHGMLGGSTASMQRPTFCSTETNEHISRTISVSSAHQHSVTVAPPACRERVPKRKHHYDADPSYKMARADYLSQPSHPIHPTHTSQQKLYHPQDDEQHFMTFDEPDPNANKNYRNERKGDGGRSRSVRDEEVSAGGERFEVGDVVWGPARGRPSWPGKLVRRAAGAGGASGAGGGWLVRWFGGEAPQCTVAAADLLTLSEGLEAHHAARTNCRKSRKLNSHLEKAIQEAMAELDKSAGGARTSPRCRRGRAARGGGAGGGRPPVRIAPAAAAAPPDPPRLRSSR